MNIYDAMKQCLMTKSLKARCTRPNGTIVWPSTDHRTVGFTLKAEDLLADDWAVQLPTGTVVCLDVDYLTTYRATDGVLVSKQDRTFLIGHPKTVAATVKSFPGGGGAPSRVVFHLRRFVVDDQCPTYGSALSEVYGRVRAGEFIVGQEWMGEAMRREIESLGLTVRVVLNEGDVLPLSR